MIFYPEHVAVARGLLSDAEVGTLFLAIVDYAENGCVADPASKPWEVCFDLMRSAIDKNAQRYAETCERNRAKANKRWGSIPQDATACNGIPQDATACHSMQVHADDANITKHNQTELNQTKLNETDSSAVADAPPTKRKRFVPPMVDEVRAYCEERRNSIDAQQFVDYYAVSGWMRGKTPIKDWKACVRMWEQKRRDTPAEMTGRVNSFADIYERI